MPMIVDLPYGDIVLSTDDAVTLLKIFEKAEKYRQKYKDGESTHHIFPLKNHGSARIITNDAYQMYKLAGEPED